MVVQNPDFAGRVALVTGAGSGIGLATALRLAQGGAEVIALDLLPDRAEAAANAIRDAGGRAMAIAADVANEAQMRDAVAGLDRLDLIVANAGANGVWAPIDDLTPAEWDQTIAVNLRGCYLTLHFGVPLLKAAGGGGIVIVASINGTRIFTSPGASAYSAAKAAQAALADQLALELAPHGIRVNSVLPGTTATNMSQNSKHRNTGADRLPHYPPAAPLPLTGNRTVEPDVVADAICLLLAPASRHVTGTRLCVDGGQSLLR